ncbi:putative Peroxidase 48 [Sesamum alatum]|uniref:Peroxidase n=1 Tax=Sesamum alatum TaxID=300844 RepID=A0AAE1YD97_9LAMI|nr:putative Peroxidase 48 [Sesamum alatum]
MVWSDVNVLCIMYVPIFLEDGMIVDILGLSTMTSNNYGHGCDASVLLDGIESEKDSLPNQSLRGFDVIDTIKQKLENACPGVVSCADIVTLGARESVLLAGGPFYPLYTCRRDSTTSFPIKATNELPSPRNNVSRILESFASKGFDESEAVSLLGAHSTGTVHCKFFNHRLYNFSGTNGPDPSIDPEFLQLLKLKCNMSSSHNSSQQQDPGMSMDYEGPRTRFGTLYYRSLLQGKGLLFADQQLTCRTETETWVRAYASDVSLFQRDFGLAMIKLSNLEVLTAPMGQVRLNCRKVN